jgi:L-ascorbate metabolism protein UlaG (beta-lactamase superfamily)
VTERSWWESARLDDLTMTCVPAQHFSGRTLWDRDRTLWGGWVVQGPHSSAYFAGDSGYFPGFKQVGEAFPGLDACLMPIGAYEPRWFMSAVHVDPAEGGQAFLESGARAMLPIHWGTFRLADEAVDEPPRVLQRWWREQKLDSDRLLLPKMGETLLLRS